MKPSAIASVPKYPGNKAIRHSMIPVDGGEVHIARVGKGFPLLLLHGWPEFWFTWEPVMMLLSEHFDVIVPDLRGFGDSSKPDGSFSSKQHAEDILAILNHFQLSKVGVVSHDLGGAVAQAFAHSQPDRIEGLFFFDFLHPGIGERFFAVDRLINTWYMFFQQTPLAVDLVTSTPESTRQYFAFFLKDWAYDKHCFDDVLDIFLENFSKPGNVAGGFEYYRTAMPPRTNPKDGIAPPSPPPILLPTCVRWSQYDKLFDFAWTDTLDQFFPNLDLLRFDGVGHFPHRENPTQAAAYIAEFFRHLTAGAARRTTRKDVSPGRRSLKNRQGIWTARVKVASAPKQHSAAQSEVADGSSQLAGGLIGSAGAAVTQNPESGLDDAAPPQR